MAKKRKRIIFFIILAVILLVCIFLDTYLLLKFNVLPIKYLVFYYIIVGLIPFLMILYTIFRKKKSKLRGIFGIIEILYIIVLIIVFIYLSKTFDFLEKFTSVYDYETKNYYLLTKLNDNYITVDDLTGLKLGYSDALDSSSEHALKELSNEVKMDNHNYDGFSSMFSGLDNDEIQGLLILSNSYDLLIENQEEDNHELENKYKILYTFSIKEKVTSMEQKDVDVTNESFNIYISGMDSFKSITDKSRSDVNIVMNVNPKTNKIVMVTIPRDYYVELQGKGQKDKLTHAGMYGIDTSIKTIEDLLGIDINYYVKVNFNAVIKLVDALDGVDVYSEYNFTSTELSHRFKKGYNHVNGELALDFVRTRYAFKNGDRVRGENQQRMIQAIINKASSPSILMRYDKFLSALEGSFTTNMSTNEITRLINMQLDKMPKWEISTYSVNGSDSHNVTYSTPHQELYVMIPNQDTIDEAKNILNNNK